MKRSNSIKSFRGFGGKHVQSLANMHDDAVQEFNLAVHSARGMQLQQPPLRQPQAQPQAQPRPQPQPTPPLNSTPSQRTRKQSITHYNGFGDHTVAALHTFDHVLPAHILNNAEQQKELHERCPHPHCSQILQSIHYVCSHVDGTMPAYNDFFEHQHILVDMVFNAMPRGVTQVFFINNPLAGLVMLIALACGDPEATLMGTIGLFFSNLTAVLMGFPRPLMQAGLYGYNGYLCGAALRVFLTWPPRWGELVTLVAVVSSFSTVLTVALGNALIPHLKIPPLTFPFNIATAIALLVARHFGRFPFTPAMVPTAVDLTELAVAANTTSTVLPTSWAWCEEAQGSLACQVFPSLWDFVLGTLRGVGQVYFGANAGTGLGVVLAIFLSSRIASLCALAGSAVGLCVAIAIGVPDGQVVQGLWGYAPALSFVAICGMFFVPTIQAAFVATFCAIVTVFVHAAITVLANACGLPTLTFGFAVGATFFTLLQRSASALVPVSLESMTTPEGHYRKYVSVLKHRRATGILSPRASQAGADNASARKPPTIKEPNTFKAPPTKTPPQQPVGPVAMFGMPPPPRLPNVKNTSTTAVDDPSRPKTVAEESDTDLFSPSTQQAK